MKKLNRDQYNRVIKMRIDILTIFPEMFESPLNHSIIKRACDAGIVSIKATDIREFADNKHKNVDDSPYGGGSGMVMMCQPIFDCFESVQAQDETPGRVIMLSPQGEKFSQKKAIELSGEKRLVFIAGRYEGFDERIRVGLNAEQISIGDYVLTGGELAAMVVIDSVVRLIDGVLGDENSSADESFSKTMSGMLEYPHYTRPEEFRSMKVPDVLLSGNHAKIEKWRQEQAIERTKKWRPDLLDK